MFGKKALLSDDKVDVANSIYPAIFSGYEITFAQQGKEYKVKTTNYGIRGTAHCTIEVEDGKVYSVPDKKY